MAPRYSEEERQVLRRQLGDIGAKERRFLASFGEGVGEIKVWSAVGEKIPEKAAETLEAAFEKGFKYMFEKGGDIIELTGNLHRIKMKTRRNINILERGITDFRLKNFDTTTSIRAWTSRGITTTKGAALGVFGIGLPDIPIFLAMILKSVYETSAGYCINYDAPLERKYILSLLKVALSNKETIKENSRACDALGEKIDLREEIEDESIEEDIKEVSVLLATDVLVAKFVQGLPVVGAVGGASNYFLIDKICKVARFKYKKRFLFKLLMR